jgi:hypothetical protein
MAPKRIDFTRRMRNDLLNRLRWNVLSPLDKVAIAVGPYEATTFVPLFGHPFANESIAYPPITRAELSSDDCERKTDWDPYYEPPAHMTIDNKDRTPITLGQFVTQAHRYLNENIEELKRVKSEIYGERLKQEDGSTVIWVTEGKPYLPPDLPFFFSRVWAMGVGETVNIGVVVWVEGELGWTTEEFWDIQMKQVRAWTNEMH